MHVSQLQHEYTGSEIILKREDSSIAGVPTAFSKKKTYFHIERMEEKTDDVTGSPFNYTIAPTAIGNTQVRNDRLTRLERGLTPRCPPWFCVSNGRNR